MLQAKVESYTLLLPARVFVDTILIRWTEVKANFSEYRPKFLKSSGYTPKKSNFFSWFRRDSDKLNKQEIYKTIYADLSALVMKFSLDLYANFSLG